jgi:hypothetical protein
MLAGVPKQAAQRTESDTDHQLSATQADRIEKLEEMC